MFGEIATFLEDTEIARGWWNWSALAPPLADRDLACWARSARRDATVSRPTTEPVPVPVPPGPRRSRVGKAGCLMFGLAERLSMKAEKIDL